MDYNALIHNRKSVRAFADKPAPASIIDEIKAYYEKDCPKLVADIATELLVLDSSVQKALEGSAGYEDLMIGAPNYLVLLSDEHEYAVENGGYIMESIILKATDLDMSTCWITFADAKEVSDALGLDGSKQVVAIAAIGYGKKTSKGLRLNIKSMSNVDIVAKRGYFAPKKSLYDMTFFGKYGKTEGLDDHIGFYGDALWDSFYAATLTPSYLNRQPFALVMQEGKVTLVSLADEYTDEVSAKLGLGIVMSHFALVGSDYLGGSAWTMGADAAGLDIPEGAAAVAEFRI